MTAVSVEEQYLFKVVTIGDSGVGKRGLIRRFSKDEPPPVATKATIGVEFSRKSILVNGRLLTGHLWDAAGKERFRAITSAYYRGAVGALVVFDITQRASFEHAERWLAELRTHADPAAVVMLVGKRSDLRDRRAVSRAEAEALAQRCGMLFFLETSCVDGDNVYADVATSASFHNNPPIAIPIGRVTRIRYNFLSLAHSGHTLVQLVESQSREHRVCVCTHTARFYTQRCNTIKY